MMVASFADYLVIGKVLRPFGLKGEVKLEPITGDINRFQRLEFIFIEKESTFQKIHVEGVRISPNVVHLKLRDYNTRDDAERLRDQYIYIDRPNAIEIDDSSYYYYDIMGCEVRTLEGNVIGVIHDIQNAGSCDVYVVRSEGPGNKEHLIPAVRDVVKEIRIDRKEIIIDVIDGLL